MATKLYLLAEKTEPVITEQVGGNGMVHTGQCKMMPQVVMAYSLHRGELAKTAELQNYSKQHLHCI